MKNSINIHGMELFYRPIAIQPLDSANRCSGHRRIKGTGRKRRILAEPEEKQAESELGTGHRLGPRKSSKAIARRQVIRFLAPRSQIRNHPHLHLFKFTAFGGDGAIAGVFRGWPLPTLVRGWVLRRRDDEAAAPPASRRETRPSVPGGAAAVDRQRYRSCSSRDLLGHLAQLQASSLSWVPYPAYWIIVSRCF